MLRQMVILVGGRGTRLGSLTANCPKPLLQVAGRPFLDILIESALARQFDRILLLAGFCGDQVETHARGWRSRNCDVSCIIEKEESGTAGALHHVRALLDETFVLMNGDSYFSIDARSLDSIAAEQDWLAKIALRHHPDAGRYGAIETDGNHVTAFNEKSAGGPGLINAGIYLLKRTILDFVPLPPSSIERDVFPLIAPRGLVYGQAFEGTFIDIGVPEDLARAQTLFAG